MDGNKVQEALALIPYLDLEEITYRRKCRRRMSCWVILEEKP